ncbi:YhgE/Pip domain-containing protein [Paenibacillus doosanensis]|uniref:YhgE/Pip domain-containing protein n=1 Tax=Paenibacillus doosanensis TaxID=1229154 RepID=UPI00217FC1E3|nr:YhgE/Pip domain-containing protein [Paenibacillus doosanensis]MCS7462942.1 YhgE/Pip domain-containing protein [Paenibacillus doosanensis]
MKNIFQIYKTDLLNIAKVPTGLLLMVALAILPSVYAWVNLKAMWDPYGNTSGIKIAVTSKDEGASAKGKTFNIGSEVISSLHDNHKLGWTFVDEEEALHGVERGDYYASLIIPADFSGKIASVLEGNPQKPEIIYTVNEKVNAVAPKITEKGASSVTTQISENFIRTVSDTVLSRMKELGLEFEAQLPTIRKIESRIFELEKRLPEIEGVGNRALEIEQKLPEIREKGDKIVRLEQQIPEIDKAGDAVLKIEERWPQIEDAAGELLLIQEKLPDIQRAADRVTELDQNFYKVEDALNKAVDDTRKAGEITSAALDALPKLEAIAVDGGAFADGLQSFLQNNDAAFQALIPVVKQNLILMQQTADDVTEITEQLQDANLDPKPFLAVLGFAADRLTTAVNVLDRQIDLFTRLNKYLPKAPLTDNIERLSAVRSNFTQQIEQIRAIVTAVQNGEKPAKDIVSSLNKLSKEASMALGSILSKYDSEIVPNVTKALDQILSVAKNSAEVLRTLKDKLPDIKGILQDAQAGIQFAASGLEALQQDLPQIRAKIHEAAEAVQTKMGQFTEALNAAAPFIRNDLPKVGQKVHQAADFVRNDLPEAEEELRKVADLYQTKFPEVESAVHQVADMVRDDLPQLEDAVHKAADEIRKVEGEGSIAELLNWLQNDMTKESDFLANPVLIQEVKKYPIPNYGSAMSPFYTTLSLWVGAMLLVSLMRVEVEDPEGIVYKSYEIYFGRMCIFLTIGFFQALIVSLGDFFILGTYVVHKFWFVVFAILISAVFVTITYTLVSVFGNIGKGIAIIFLVLQFSSSGGTFPVSTAATFFQKLNPFVPFTYAVGAMREAVGGILLSAVLKDVLFLIVFIAVCYVVALALKKPLSGYTKRVAEKARQTKLIS